MNPSFEYLAEHYEGLDDLRNDFRNRNLNELIMRNIRGTSVLDIGCGCGHLLNLARKGGKNVRGVEPNKKLIAASRRIYGGLPIKEGGGEKISELRSLFDTITIIDVLEHIEGDGAQLGRIFRKLVRGGRLIVVVPAHPFLYGKRDKNAGHYRRYTKKGLISLLRKHGFSVVSIRHWNALGVLPYLFYEKVLGREFNTSLRRTGKKGEAGAPRRFASWLLQKWFEDAENFVDFGFGLSLLCVAQKR